jgi:hypothetical protein
MICLLQGRRVLGWIVSNVSEKESVSFFRVEKQLNRLIATFRRNLLPFSLG